MSFSSTSPFHARHRFHFITALLWCPNLAPGILPSHICTYYIHARKLGVESFRSVISFPLYIYCTASGWYFRNRAIKTTSKCFIHPLRKKESLAKAHFCVRIHESNSFNWVWFPFFSNSSNTMPEGVLQSGRHRGSKNSDISRLRKIPTLLLSSVHCHSNRLGDILYLLSDCSILEIGKHRVGNLLSRCDWANQSIYSYDCILYLSVPFCIRI